MKAETLRLLGLCPGATVSELADYADLRDPRKVGRRLPELEREGKVRRVTRKCAITGRQASAWYPVG